MFVVFTPRHLLYHDISVHQGIIINGKYLVKLSLILVTYKNKPEQQQIAFSVQNYFFVQ